MANKWQGLTTDEARNALQKYGENEIADKSGRGRWLILVDQFKSALVVLLVGAAGVSAVVGDRKDTVLILAIVGLNGVLGWVQEFKAEEAIAALKKMGGGKVRVVRDGKNMLIDSREVVPGEVMYVADGDRIVADGKVLEAVSLEVNESALTGESMPVGKSDGEK